MRREPAWRRYLRLFGADIAADFDDELQFHLETKIEELTAAGWSPGQAREEALRQFGPVRPIRQECTRISRERQVRASRVEYFVSWLRDIRHAVRSLRRASASSMAAILILAAGIGATTAVFTLLDRLLLAPLPVERPAQLLFLSADIPPRRGDAERLRGAAFTAETYRNLRDHSRSLGIGAESHVRIRESQKTPLRAEGYAVSDDYFGILGVNARLGRVFTGGDTHAAVISDRFWSSRFGRSPDVLGRTLYLENRPYTIVGVLPRGFFGLHRGGNPDAYVTIASLPPEAGMIYSDGRWLSLFGRLRQGTSASVAAAELQTLMPPDEHIEWEGASHGSPGTWGEQRRSLWLLAAIVAGLLLIGCANVACLLLARGAARQQEMAVRLALGAGRMRVLRELLLESSLLSLTGGAAGLGLALVGERQLIAAFQWQDRPLDLSLDARVLIFSAGLSLATGILFGLIPALQLWRGGRLALARERTLTPRFGSGRALVILEVALSLVLVAGAAVFLRSFQNLRAIPTGFSTDRVSVIELANSTEPEALRAPYREASLLADSLRHAPGVEAVGISDMVPFNQGAILYQVTAPSQPDQPMRQVHLLRVDGDYFGALRVSLQTGRTFTPRDDLSAPKVAIVTEGTARRLFAGQNPLGKRILVGLFPHPKLEDETEIVGVVNDIKFGSVTAPAPDLIFQPLLQGQNNSATTSTLQLHVRSRMKPAEAVALVRSRIGEMRMPVSVDDAAPLEDAIAHSMLNDRIRMQASGIFAGLALLLITAGIYGLMAYSVTMRTREIGIRMAVGSRPGEIVAMVLRQGLRLTVAGVVLGVPGALLVMRAISGLVFGLAPVDWTSVAAAGLILCITGIAASVGPAWRAAHLDPVEALRVE